MVSWRYSECIFYTLTKFQNNDLRKLVEENYIQAKSVQELAQMCGYFVRFSSVCHLLKSVRFFY